ncbi:hypothetical protein [Candidatus Vidania fulgoroideorum]
MNKKIKIKTKKNFILKKKIKKILKKTLNKEIGKSTLFSIIDKNKKYLKKNKIRRLKKKVK